MPLLNNLIICLTQFSDFWLKKQININFFKKYMHTNEQMIYSSLAKHLFVPKSHKISLNQWLSSICEPSLLSKIPAFDSVVETAIGNQYLNLSSSLTQISFRLIVS